MPAPDETKEKQKKRPVTPSQTNQDMQSK